MNNEIVAVDNSKFLNFQEAKVQTLTLDQLHKTHKETDVYGKPLKGMHHYEVIDKVIDQCQSAGFNVEVYDLFAAHNSDRQSPGVVLLPQEEAIYGANAVEAHILRRVFANIRITDLDDDDYTTNFSIAFHQRGVQVGFGNNVKICHNQCMLNADMYAATYSENGRNGIKYDLPQLFEVIAGWIANAGRVVMDDRERIKRMKEIIVEPRKVLELIGGLTSTRIAHDTRHKSIRVPGVYPLNQSQICDFTEGLMLKAQEKPNLTVWDLYDQATSLYKANTMDIPSILPQNRAFVRVLEENFGI